MRTNRSMKAITALVLLLSLVLIGSIPAVAHEGQGGVAESGLFFVDYTNLGEGADGVVLMNLDPESADFGQIIQQVELGEGVVPHHLYYNSDQSRLYNTALRGPFLYELILERDVDGVPTITDVITLDTGNNIVGEDMYFSKDGSRFWMTFMGGSGGDKDGTVGMFDAVTNELLETIVAPVPDDAASTEPFIMYPHGISANEDLGYMLVTSTQHPDGVTGAGNTVTLIDMETNNPVQTQLVGASLDDVSMPVEVLLLRDEFPAYALATTIGGGDIWIAPQDEETGLLGDFTEVFDGGAQQLGVALEFYVGPGLDTESDEDKLLYVSFAAPGVIKVFSLENLPELVELKTLPAEAGAHHMAFFKTESGREVMVVQNNLLNVEGINAGTLTIVDIHSGELLGKVDMPQEYGLMAESIESAFGNAHFVHH